MTLIRFFRTRPTADGTRVPASGTLRFTPTRERVVVGDPDEVILPISFSVQVPKDTGRADVDLAPTGPGWVWEVYSHSFGVTAEYAYVVVPEPVPDPDIPGEFLPVDEPDLVRVDKDTLDPAAVPDPLWWAELEAAKALASDVELARVDAAGSATSAAQSATDSGASAGEASASASNAAASALSASESATQAGTSADLANASAVSAGTALTGAESARDATVAAAGGSELSAQAAANAATASAQSAADAEAAALDVVTRADAGEFKGDQGLPGNATVRFSTTAGKAIYLTEPGTAVEHLIYGDTGRRIVPVGMGGTGSLLIRRVGSQVTFAAASVAWPDGTGGISVYQPPLGFRASDIGTAYIYQPFRAGGSTNMLYTILSGNSVGVSGVWKASDGSLSFVLSWTTSDPWPTVLPGIPA